MAVFVLDKTGKALMPCTEKRARLLLQRGRARVHRIMPFIIRLIDRKTKDSAFQSLRIKLDPGSKATGIALVLEEADTITVLNLFELVHRGHQIKAALGSRTLFRKGRRSRSLRYRAPRFLNRGNNRKGWLAPSLLHRVHTILAWVNRLLFFAPVEAISTELVRFDTQLMQHPEIAGVEYQQGELQGYEVREYLLEKWGRQCAYCDQKEAPLQVDHILAKASGGTNRVSNLTLACQQCNQRKSKKDIRDFLRGDAARLARILSKAKRPLRDAAIVNATRWKLFNALSETGLPIEVASGGRTKFNRSCLSIPKTHALDAVCVGRVGAVHGWRRPTLTIRCTGRGCYQRTRVTANGFPRGYLIRQKQIRGFQTGDLVRATVPTGKKKGTYVGRVAIRATGSFNIQTAQGVIQGISHRYCKTIQRGDGYGYSWGITMDMASNPQQKKTSRVSSFAVLA